MTYKKLDIIGIPRTNSPFDSSADLVSISVDSEASKFTSECNSDSTSITTLDNDPFLINGTRKRSILELDSTEIKTPSRTQRINSYRDDSILLSSTASSNTSEGSNYISTLKGFTPEGRMSGRNVKRSAEEQSRITLNRSAGILSDADKITDCNTGRINTCMNESAHSRVKLNNLANSGFPILRDFTSTSRKKLKYQSSIIKEREEKDASYILPF